MVQGRLREIKSGISHLQLIRVYKSRGLDAGLVFISLSILCLNILEPYKCWNVKDLPGISGGFLVIISSQLIALFQCM